jgi:hypothetical protein
VGLQVCEEATCDLGEGDLADVELLALYQLEEEVERAFEDFEMDLVGDGILNFEF